MKYGETEEEEDHSKVFDGNIFVSSLKRQFISSLLQ